MDLITLNSSGLRCVVVPELGGKIVSLFMKEKQCEIVAAPTRPLFPADEEPPSFGRHGIAGLDDCFPNIDAEETEIGGRKLVYPDHGEIWSRRMTVEAQTEAELKLSYDSTAFGYHYEKTYRLCGNQLTMRWEIENTGTEALPCIWTFHGLMRFEKDSVLVYPEDVREFRLVYQLPGPGIMDRRVAYPFDDPDLYHFPQGEEPSCLKAYAPEKVQQGFCSVIHPADGVRVNVRYDAEQLPWLGIWIDDNVYGKCRNFAFEMTNGYFDQVSRAEKNGKLLKLAPGEKLSFWISIAGEALEEPA